MPAASNRVSACGCRRRICSRRRTQWQVRTEQVRGAYMSRQVSARWLQEGCFAVARRPGSRSHAYRVAFGEGAPARGRDHWHPHPRKQSTGVMSSVADPHGALVWHTDGAWMLCRSSRAQGLLAERAADFLRKAVAVPGGGTVQRPLSSSYSTGPHGVDAYCRPSPRIHSCNSIRPSRWGTANQGETQHGRGLLRSPQVKSDSRESKLIHSRFRSATEKLLPVAPHPCGTNKHHCQCMNH